MACQPINYRGRQIIVSRSTEKGPFVHERLLKRTEEMSASRDKRVIKTWSRSPTIFPQMIGHTIAVHDGREHIPVFTSEGTAGHKPGGFTLTGTYRGHDYDERAARRKK